MFSRITLLESFRHVASSDEWEEFSAFGEVTSMDLSIHAMGAGLSRSKSRLDGYERLWMELARRVRQKLLGGVWIAEGFSPGGLPQAQQIDPHLWNVLELNLMDGGADGAGFKFVNLLISSREPNRASIPGGQTIRLGDTLDLVANPAEAEEYARLKHASQSPGIWYPGEPETRYDREHRLCRAVQANLWAKVLPRLTSGEWVAYGFTKAAIEPVRVPATLWPHLDCDFDRDEAIATNGTGHEFFSVTFVQAKSSESASSHRSAAAARQKLIRWLEERGKTEAGRVTKAELLGEARNTFRDHPITDNLFNEAWRAASLPEHFRRHGRRKS